MAQDSKFRDESPLSLDGERQKTIESLSNHFAHDNISLDELERRIEDAYRASSVPALRDLTRDLPSDAADAQQRRVAPLPEVFAPERDRIVSVMAETKRRGLWRPARHLDLWCVMSDTRLDLTEALLPSGVTEIHLHGLMCTIRVIVPPGVRIVVQPSAFMSTVSDESFESYDPPHVGTGAPVIRITGTLIMGELKVRARTREQF